MIGYLRQVTPFELASFRRNPKQIQDLLNEETLDAFPAHVGAQDQFVTNRARLDQKRLDLGKSWHLLHYLLTGSANEAPPPLGNAILGGRPIGPDVGYGPARFLTPREVQDVAVALWEITSDQLANRFDPAAIVRAGIYAYGGVPSSLRGDLDIDDLDTECLSTFVSLGDYYNAAAESGNGMLLYIR